MCARVVCAFLRRCACEYVTPVEGSPCFQALVTAWLVIVAQLRAFWGMCLVRTVFGIA